MQTRNVASLWPFFDRLYARGSPPAPDSLVSARIASDAVENAVRALLPLKLALSSLKTASPSGEISDLKLCGITPTGAHFLALGSEGTVQAARDVRMLGTGDCKQTAMSLASKFCDSIPKLIGTVDVSWSGWKLMLEATGVWEFQKSSTMCETRAIEVVNGITTIPTDDITLGFSPVYRYGVAIRFGNDLLEAWLVPYDRLKFYDNLSLSSPNLPQRSTPVNLAVSVPIDELNRLLPQALSRNPILLGAPNLPDGLPKTLALRTGRIVPSPDNELKLEGEISTEGAGDYTVLITLEGDELSVASISASYKSEVCNQGDISKRLECIGRNEIRKPLAVVLGQLLTGVYQHLPVRPFTSALESTGSINGRGIAVSGLMGALTQRQGKVLLDGFLVIEQR